MPPVGPPQAERKPGRTIGGAVVRGFGTGKNRHPYSKRLGVGQRLGVHPGARGPYTRRLISVSEVNGVGGGPRDEYPKPGESYCEPCEPSGYSIRIPIPRIQQRSISATAGPGRSCSGKISYRFPVLDWPRPQRMPHVIPARGPDWPARCRSSLLLGSPTVS